MSSFESFPLQRYVGETHPCVCSCSLVIHIANSTPLYKQTHYVCIYFTADGHLDCFKFEVVMLFRTFFYISAGNTNMHFPNVLNEIFHIQQKKENNFILSTPTLSN